MSAPLKVQRKLIAQMDAWCTPLPPLLASPRWKGVEIFPVGKRGEPCPYCRTGFAESRDHIEPRILGHSLLNNSALVCLACNEAKSADSLLRFLCLRAKAVQMGTRGRYAPPPHKTIPRSRVKRGGVMAKYLHATYGFEANYPNHDRSAWHACSIPQ